MTHLATQVSSFIRRLLEAWALPALLVAAWWWRTKDGTDPFFPPLSDILDRFVHTWLDTRLQSDLLPSLSRVGIGFALACVIGIAIGLLLSASRGVERVVEPLIAFLRSIPSAALVPFAILAFGIGTNMQVFLITLVCIWPILMNTMEGVANVEPTMLETAKVFRIRRSRRIGRIVLFAAAPRIASGMRTSLALAIVVMLISEMAGSTNGIGYVTIQAQRTFAAAEMWAGVLTLALLGFFLNWLFVRLERVMLKWNFESKGIS